MLTVKLTCKKHPTYCGHIAPRVRCMACSAIYVYNTPKAVQRQYSDRSVLITEPIVEKPVSIPSSGKVINIGLYRTQSAGA